MIKLVIELDCVRNSSNATWGPIVRGGGFLFI